MGNATLAGLVDLTKEPAYPVWGALSMLDQRVGALEELVARMGKRLEPILGPSPPTNADGNIKEDSSASKVVVRMRETGARLEGMAARIEFFLSVLEV